ncbi:hypothetical protein M9Y10_029312 [Tritrichomonas musculus]|uniref:DUF4200 domain-containing protein n=1 Tax=Tritrichomonas musculus TaxID=1915356 RepID=A0ABR2KLU3_9EUKA
MNSVEHLRPLPSAINISPIPPNKHLESLNLEPKYNHVRDLHRDQIYEDQMTLVDQKYRLVTEINEIRKENEALKKELAEKDKEFTIQAQAIINLAKTNKKEEENALQLKRVMEAQKKLDDLLVLHNELTSQYNFLYAFFSNAKEVELRSYTGLQSNQAFNETEELESIQVVLQKAVNRLEGPVAANRQVYEDRSEKIAKLKQYLKIISSEEENITTEVVNQEPQILPEELMVVRDDLKHKLEILQHRKYNRMKEMQQMRRRTAIQRVTAEELMVAEEKAKREANERARFRDRMQRKHQLEIEEEIRRQRAQKEEEEKIEQAVAQEEEDDFDEKWRMLTHVKEAQDQHAQDPPPS